MNEKVLRVAQRIKECRVAACMTQKDLAQAIGVNQAIISKYESGDANMSIVRVVAIAEALGVAPSTLMA